MKGASFTWVCVVFEVCPTVASGYMPMLLYTCRTRAGEQERGKVSDVRFIIQCKLLGSALARGGRACLLLLSLTVLYCTVLPQVYCRR